MVEMEKIKLIDIKQEKLEKEFLVNEKLNEQNESEWQIQLKSTCEMENPKKIRIQIDSTKNRI